MGKVISIVTVFFLLIGIAYASKDTTTKITTIDMNVCGSQGYDDGNESAYDFCTITSTLNKRMYSQVNVKNKVALEEVIKSYVTEASECNIVDIVCRTIKVKSINALIAAINICKAPEYKLTRPVYYSRLLEFEAYRLVLINDKAFTPESSAEQKIAAEINRLVQSLGITGLDIDREGSSLMKDYSGNISEAGYRNKYIKEHSLSENVILLKKRTT
ncbi:hypothetical protein L9F34_004455 [Klebsiella aerogenes]|nr:hypothetical protein [Klebsiella aerogenes]